MIPHLQKFVLVLLLVTTSSVVFADGALSAKVEELDGAIKKQPTNVLLLLKRAKLHLVDARPELTIRDASMVLRIERNPEAFLLRGRAFLAKGDAGNAILDLTRNIGSDKYSFDGYWHRATAFSSFGWHDRALLDIRAAARLAPSVDVVLKEAEILGKLARSPEALQLIEESRTNLGDATLLNLTAYEFAMEIGAFENAVDASNRLVAKARFKTSSLLKRADAYEALGAEESAVADREAALVDAHRVIAIRRSPLNLRIRAEAYLSLARYSDAIDDLSAAVARQPDLTRAYDLLQHAKEKRRTP